MPSGGYVGWISMIKRLVVKIGTSLLTRDGGHLDSRRMSRFVRELTTIHRSGVDVLLVTSGAIAAGTHELGWRKRPSFLAQKQAAAAVGQVRLMERYRTYFARQGITVAQVLLTREDFRSRARDHNAQATLHALLQSKVIPIINENDTVAVEEIRFGDNDTLAALVAIKAKADLLILLTDVDGLMTRHPQHGRGDLIACVERIGPSIDALAHAAPGSDHASGGMQTKVSAARRVMAHGVRMVIANGKKKGTLTKILEGRPTGTIFLPPPIRTRRKPE